jgi:5-bromo-4-chloroindolyl phosphate hydrolysis protein
MMKKLFKKIKDFFNQPDRMELAEERFYKRLEDIKAHPEKYAHLNKSSTSSKIPPVSLF